MAFALELPRDIARGKNRVGELLVPGDFTRGRTDIPMRFEIEVKLATGLYGYPLRVGIPQRIQGTPGPGPNFETNSQDSFLIEWRIELWGRHAGSSQRNLRWPRQAAGRGRSDGRGGAGDGSVLTPVRNARNSAGFAGELLAGTR